MADALKEKIAELIKRGATQLSRKGRIIAIPPALPPDKTSYLDVFKDKYPLRWENFERIARETIASDDRSCHMTLDFDEFNEWLVQNNRVPVARPPEPYATWDAYWAENTEHPKGVRR